VAGWAEAEFGGVEAESSDGVGVAPKRRSPASEWPSFLHVDADLVLAAGLEFYLEEGEVVGRAENAVVGDGEFAWAVAAAPGAGAVVPRSSAMKDSRVPAKPGWAEDALGEGVVDALGLLVWNWRLRDSKASRVLAKTSRQRASLSRRWMTKALPG